MRNFAEGKDAARAVLLVDGDGRPAMIIQTVKPRGN
jgi:hypothetical protein